MSSSNCCFLTCIQVSQEAGRVVWYSHLFQNFPQFIVIHTIKGFGIVNKAEIDVFLELSYIFHDPVDVGNLISGSSAFSKTSLISGSSRFTYCWSLAWRILENFSEYVTIYRTLSFPWRSAGKETACNAGDLGLIPGFGKSPEGGHGNPLQYSCLKKPHGQRSLEAIAHGVAKSQTWLSN